MFNFRANCRFRMNFSISLKKKRKKKNLDLNGLRLVDEAGQTECSRTKPGSRGRRVLLRRRQSYTVPEIGGGSRTACLASVIQVDGGGAQRVAASPKQGRGSPVPSLSGNSREGREASTRARRDGPARRDGAAGWGCREPRTPNPLRDFPSGLLWTGGKEEGAVSYSSNS